MEHKDDKVFLFPQAFMSLLSLACKGKAEWISGITVLLCVFRAELHEGDVQVSVEELRQGAEYCSGDPETHPHRTPRVRTLRLNQVQIILKTVQYIKC